MSINIKSSAPLFTLANGTPSHAFQTSPGYAMEKQAVIKQRQLLQSRIINTSTTAALVFRALSSRQGFSLIRLGDSELLVLAQDLLFPTSIPMSQWGALMADLCCDPDLGQGDDEVNRWDHIVRVSGNQYPDYTARYYLIKALSAASLIGIPCTYRPGRSVEHVKLLEGFQTVFLNVLYKLNIPLKSLLVTDSAEHHLLHASGWLRRILVPNQYPDLGQHFGLPSNYQPRIILAGNLASPFANLLAREGCQIAAAIQPVGISNIEDVIRQIGLHSFDLALVSAGTAAKYICTSIA
ncbi:MAG: hypothetical protein ABFC94_15735, partial [Syntrophomonas sp.]